MFPLLSSFTCAAFSLAVIILDKCFSWFICDVQVDMPESESESDSSGSHRSSYSSESFHSEDERESKAKKKDAQQNKAASTGNRYLPSFFC